MHTRPLRHGTVGETHCSSQIPHGIRITQHADLNSTLGLLSRSTCCRPVSLCCIRPYGYVHTHDITVHPRRKTAPQSSGLIKWDLTSEHVIQSQPHQQSRAPAMSWTGIRLINFTEDVLWPVGLYRQNSGSSACGHKRARTQTHSLARWRGALSRKSLDETLPLSYCMSDSGWQLVTVPVSARALLHSAASSTPHNAEILLLDEETCQHRSAETLRAGYSSSSEVDVSRLGCAIAEAVWESSRGATAACLPACPPAALPRSLTAGEPHSAPGARAPLLSCSRPERFSLRGCQIFSKWRSRMEAKADGARGAPVRLMEQPHLAGKLCGVR